MSDLIEWFEEAGGFSQGTKAPHKWVLQAEQELRIQTTALAEAQATIARQQVMLDRALEDNGGMMAEIVRLRGALDDIYRHVDWWSTRRISSHIRAALSRPHATKGEAG